MESCSYPPHPVNRKHPVGNISYSLGEITMFLGSRIKSEQVCIGNIFRVAHDNVEKQSNVIQCGETQISSYSNPEMGENPVLQQHFCGNRGLQSGGRMFPVRHIPGMDPGIAVRLVPVGNMCA